MSPIATASAARRNRSATTAKAISAKAAANTAETITMRSKFSQRSTARSRARSGPGFAAALKNRVESNAFGPTCGSSW